MKTRGWRTIVFSVLSAAKGLYLVNNLLLSLYVPSAVNSTRHLLMVLFYFLFYPSASSFLPSNGILFAGSIISVVLH